MMQTLMEIYIVLSLVALAIKLKLLIKSFREKKPIIWPMFMLVPTAFFWPAFLLSKTMEYINSFYMDWDDWKE